MTNANLRADPRYTPYQRDFFSRFAVEFEQGSVHLLWGPVGSGKSFAMAGSISELAKARCVRRTLVLAPAALVEQWADLLEGRGLDPSSSMVGISPLGFISRYHGWSMMP